MLPLPIKLFSVGLLVALIASGCVTRAQANARAQAAYLAGQKAALASIAGQGQGVVIVGPVEHPNVPWVEGLTLAQAIATANYTTLRNPKVINITRQGEDASINPRDLLGGHVVPLEPGDTIKIQEYFRRKAGADAWRLTIFDLRYTIYAACGNPTAIVACQLFLCHFY